MAEQMSGWTRHGHRISGMVQIGEPKSVARCGGPGLCAQCSVEAARRTEQMTADQSAPLTPDTPDPAVTEGETDASGKVALTEAVLLAEWWVGQGGDYVDPALDSLATVVERIIRERVRVVEGERDAARAEGFESYNHGHADGLREGKDEAETRDLSYDALTARAESAEAALAAEKEAHAGLRAVLDDYFDFDVNPWDDHDAACPAPEDLWRLHRDIRALLAGGGE